MNYNNIINYQFYYKKFGDSYYIQKLNVFLFLKSDKVY